jgi:hypothetical protein
MKPVPEMLLVVHSFLCDITIAVLIWYAVALSTVAACW